MANTTTKIDINKIKDITLGEVFKKKYPKLIIPMMGLMAPIWDVIKANDAKFSVTDKKK